MSSVLLSTFFWDKDSQWTRSSPILLDKLGRKPQDCAISAPSVLGIRTNASTSVEFRPSTSCLHSSAVLTDMAPALQAFFFFFCSSLGLITLPPLQQCDSLGQLLHLYWPCGRSISIPQKFHFQKVKAHNSKWKKNNSKYFPDHLWTGRQDCCM